MVIYAAETFRCAHQYVATPEDGRVLLICLNCHRRTEELALVRPANFKVLALDNPPGPCKVTANHRVISWRARGRGEPLGQEAADAVTHQQIVLEADEQARFARVTLPSGGAGAGLVTRTGVRRRQR
jgi:hypothetical protein